MWQQKWGNKIYLIVSKFNDLRGVVRHYFDSGHGNSAIGVDQE